MKAPVQKRLNKYPDDKKTKIVRDGRMSRSFAAAAFFDKNGKTANQTDRISRSLGEFFVDTVAVVTGIVIAMTNRA